MIVATLFASVMITSASATPKEEECKAIARMNHCQVTYSARRFGGLFVYTGDDLNIGIASTALCLAQK
jgi:hypothetical protein